MNKKKLPICSILPLSLSASFLSTPIYAKDAAKIEEVITAQMRKESLVKVPISIDVIDKSLIENLSASELSQLENAIPSLNFGRAGRKTRGELAIRGVSDFARNIGTNGRVVVYIDDVPLGRSSAFDLNLLDIKQVDVLKGPQGTLFGANTIAGAVNIITEDPGDRFANTVRVKLGNRDHRQLAVTSNIPLGDTAAIRVNVSKNQTEGHVDNISLNRKLMEDDSDSARIKIKVAPSEQLSFIGSFDWLSEEIDATNSEALADDGTFNGYSLTPDAFSVAHDTNEFEERDIWGASLKANYVLASEYELTSISAYRRSKFDEQSEEDYSPIPAVTSRFDEEYKQATQEFRLASPVHDTYDYVVGAYFSKYDISTHRRADLLIPGVFASTPAELNANLYALFFNGNYRISQRFEVNFGARYQREKKELDYTIIDTSFQFTNDSLQDEKTFSDFLPKISFNYHIGDSSMAYVSVSKGTKSGGWNADFLTSLDDIDFDQENAISREIGYKSRYFENKLSLNIAAFETKFDDFQVFQFQQQGGTTVIKLDNAAEATTKGIEFEIQAQAGEYTKLTLNATYNKAEFDEYKNGGGPNVDYDGNALPYSPELVGFVAIDQSVPLWGDTLLTGHLNYSYSDGSYSQPSNADAFEIDSHRTWNGRISLDFNRHWNVAIWGRNLTDEEYLRSRDRSFLGISRGVYEDPRSYGVSFTFSH